MSVIQLSVGDTRVDVAPDVGGRVANITHRGVDLLIGPQHSTASSPLAWGCYPMVPWCGRIGNGQFSWDEWDIHLELNAGNHAMHGTVFDVPWTVDAVTDRRVQMSCSLARRGWPFKGEVLHVIDIEDGHVSMALEVRAYEAMPVQIGWHPWFVKPVALATTFTSMYVRAADYSTTEQCVQPTSSPWDDCFLGGEVQSFVVGDVTVSLKSSCDHWVIYDMPTHATCIEPQSGPPNGVNIGHIDVARAGTPVRHTFDVFLD